MSWKMFLFSFNNSLQACSNTPPPPPRLEAILFWIMEIKILFTVDILLVGVHIIRWNLFGFLYVPLLL